MRTAKIAFTSVAMFATILLALSCQQSSSTATDPGSNRPELTKGNGIYVTPRFQSQREIERFIDLCKKLKINKIFVLTKSTDGNVQYPSKKFRVAKYVSDFDAYGALRQAARRENIAVHAWFCIFAENAKDPVPIIKQHPEYLIVNRQGKSNVEQPTWSTVDPKYSKYWVCPTAKGYIQYLEDMMQEVIDRYDVDGIHLDYIRYPEEVEARQYCYCDRCRALFKKNYGYTLPANDVIKNRYWVTQMCDNVTNAVKEFADFAHKRGKLISAYVFTDYTTAIEAVYQDWPWFSRYLDFLIPTSYEVSPAYIHELAVRTKAVISPNCRLFPTIYSAPVRRRSEDGGVRWYNGRPEDVPATFKAWLDEGVDGVVFFNYGLLMNPKYLTDGQRTKIVDQMAAMSQQYFNN